jgi:hypothetical protein
MYTVKVHSSSSVDAERVYRDLAKRFRSDGRFSVDMIFLDSMTKGKRDGSRKPGFGIGLRKVRLTEAKPYCGQHPGECLVNPFAGPTKKKRMTLLEWDDWVEFNGLVNDVLDEHGIDADVWSNPQETKGTMWIRKGQQRRLRYDYDDDFSGSWSRTTGLPVRVWNEGTHDQFCVS